MATKKTAKKTTAKKPASKAGMRAVQHKAYSYKNKAGKTVHVAAHVEYIKAK